jgi:hypothetical protein
MNETFESRNQEATKVIKIRPASYFLNNFTFDRLYCDKIQIKNLMSFPIVLNIRSSDGKKMQVSEKIVKVNAKQTVRVGFSLRIETHIKTTCIRNLFIWIYNDLIDYKYFLNLNTKFDKLLKGKATDNNEYFTEVPEAEPSHTDGRENYHTHENFRNQYITIEGLSSDRNKDDEIDHFDQNELVDKVDEVTLENRQLSEENFDRNLEGFDNQQQLEETGETLKSEYVHERLSLQSPIKENSSNRSSKSLDKRRNKSGDIFSYFSGKDTTISRNSIGKEKSEVIEKKNNFNVLQEIKQSYVSLVYSNYNEHKKRNSEIITIMDNLIELTNTNLSNIDYRDETIHDNAIRIEGLIKKFIEGINIYDKHLCNAYEQNNIRKRLDSGYLNIDLDSLQVELAKLKNYEDEIVNLKTQVRRLEMENDGLKTGMDSNIIRSERSLGTGVFKRELEYLFAENNKNQEIINAKNDFIFRKEEELRQLRRNFDKLITERNSRLNNDFVDSQEVKAIIAEKDKTIYELRENLSHSTNVIQNLKQIIHDKTSQKLNNQHPYHSEPETHYVTLIESLKRDIRCKDEIIADFCETEYRGQECITDLKSLSLSMRNEQLERTMDALSEEVEKQKFRNSVILY